MSVPSMSELERQLRALPREAWERPVPPPPPWPVGEAPAATANGHRPRPVAPAPFGRRRRPLIALRPLTAGALSLLLLAAGLGAGLLIAGGGSSPGGPAEDALTVRLQAVGGGGPDAAGLVTLSGRAGGSASVRLSGLAPNTGGEFYELWLLGNDGELVSLGSVRVPRTGSADLRVRLPVDPRRFRYLDVSREPADGDPSHSADSVLRGPAS
jgi:Anti-sigma-K factor rskA